MPSIDNALMSAEEILRESGVAEPRREAISLLTFATGREKAFVYAHPEHELSADDVRTLDAILQRRAAREPLQYITGRQEFYGREFVVTPDVLIPRPETEMVVEQSIALLKDTSSICEVGVGSGCIAISILAEVNGAQAVGLDVSPRALAVARRNAERHGVADRLRLVESDVFDRLGRDGRFDLIVSNPPYVPVRDLDGLQAEVRDFEPVIALTDGGDGLSVVRRIVDQAPMFLVNGGYLLIEIGFDQSERVAGLFSSDIWQRPELLPDLQGIPRLVKANLVR